MFVSKFIIVIAIVIDNILGSEVNKAHPNILLIVTDDQDVVLQGMVPMVETRRLIGLKGITFINAFTSSPICCPSRSSILSGLYAHNHGTKNNSINGGCYGKKWKTQIEPKALPVVMKNNGYETFFIGKYLNQYKDIIVPPGWSNFFGLHGNSVYYNFVMTENGKSVTYKDEYFTDVISKKVQQFIENRSLDHPFFAMIAPTAPHAPYTPANRHNSSFIGTKAMKTPNFNIISGPLDKHWLVASGKKISQLTLDTLDNYYRKRWQTLLAVDEMVSSIVTSLEVTRQLDNTFIIFTSDNGYHVGQFAQPFDKRQPYENDIRVPFLVRGPNIPEKSISTYPIVLIDLFPTILEWSGINLLGNEDGISINKLILKSLRRSENNKKVQRQILVEYWGEGNEKTFNSECPWKRSDNLAECTLEADCHCQDSWNNTYFCVRHFALNTNKIYCEFKDHQNFVEAYDLDEDFYEMKNLGFEMLPSERAFYSLSLQKLKLCMGSSCHIM